MFQWEELKEISVDGFRGVFEFGAGGDHSLCPEAFGITLRTSFEAKHNLSWCLLLNFLGIADQGVCG